MAVKPTDATLTTWLGSGAATTGVAAAGYYIPQANVAKYIGASGTDTVISNDIRDFLFSVLSKCEETYSAELPTGDTRATGIIVTKAVSTINNTVTFSVRLAGVTVSQPSDYIASLPTYA